MLLLPASSGASTPQRGSTLLLSLLATVVVVSLSAIFLQLTSSVARRQTQSADQKRSFYLAEAGLAEAYAGMRAGKSGDVGSEASPAGFGNGLFWVTAEDLGDGLVALASTGMCGTTLSELDMVVSKGEASVAALGVFSAGDLTIGSGSSLSFFDSDPAAGGGGAAFGGSGLPQRTTTATLTETTDGRITEYEDLGTEGVARVACNGNIKITEGTGAVTQVLGDLRPGKGRSLVQVGTPTITGSTANLTTPIVLPAVDVPIYTQRPGYYHSAPQPLVLPPINGSYQYLAVAGGTELTLTGPSIIVLEQLVVDAGAQVTFDTLSGPIDIFITGKLNLTSGSNLEVTSSSSLDLSIQSSGISALEVGASCNFYGTLYAPNAEIIVAESFLINGSVVADQLTFNGACQLNFDEALGRAAVLDALPVLVTWRIETLDPNAIPSGDPFGQLGVVRSTLDTPTRAHKDLELKILYIDINGLEQIYGGWESNFDWSQVAQVLNLKRAGTSSGGIDGLASIGALGDSTGLIGTTDSTKTQSMTPSRITRLTAMK